MIHHPPIQADWNPSSEQVLCDQRAAYDRMRDRCPVAFSDLLQWSLFRHRDVIRVLHDPQTFSNAVSQHLSVPNGMDPPEHTVYRRIIEPYFAPSRMQAFEPVCREITGRLVERLLENEQVELEAELARPFAVQVQCGFLGWPADLHAPLVRWTNKNHAATLAQDRRAMSAVAREFEGFIDELLEARWAAGAKPDDDLTAALMHEQVWGRPLSNEEIASILRNWTVGEVGTIAASVGILAQYLAEHPQLQEQLRTSPSRLPVAIDEILRIHGPLVASRRVATWPVEIGGRQLPAGARISLMWISANRDSEVFDQPDTFRWDRDPKDNLLYGAGIHVCPGAPLARLELRVMLETLLQRTARIELVPDQPPKPAVYPASGFAVLPLRVYRR